VRQCPQWLGHLQVHSHAHLQSVPVVNNQWRAGHQLSTISRGWGISNQQSIVAGAKPFTTQNAHHNIHIYLTQPQSPSHPHILTWIVEWGLLVGRRECAGGCGRRGRFHTLSPLEGLKLYHTYNKILAVAGMCVCVTGMCVLWCVSIKPPK